jgi:hypothetical protein
MLALVILNHVGLPLAQGIVETWLTIRLVYADLKIRMSNLQEVEAAKINKAKLALAQVWLVRMLLCVCIGVYTCARACLLDRITTQCTH